MRKLLIILIIFSYTSQAQELHENTLKENHDHNYRTEFGIAMGLAYIDEEKEIKPSIHLHLVNSLKKVDWLKLGVGFESLLDKHVHVNPTFVINYKINHKFTIGTSPGLLFLKEGSNWERTFSMHF